LLEHALGDRATARLISSRPVHLVAAGKAAAPMAAAFLRLCPRGVLRGVVSGTHAPEPFPPELAWFQAGHPVPNMVSAAAGTAALEVARTLDPRHRLIVLLSGGASALLVRPADGVDLDDKQRVTRHLLAAGADIHALNAVRKHLSAVKGGALAAAARGPTVALAISDVIGDDFSVIGSGPTVADPSTFSDALGILDRFGGRDLFPEKAVAVLERGDRGEIPETPKPGDPRLAGSVARVIGSRLDALRGAADAAERLGYRVEVLIEPVVGEARAAGHHQVERMLSIARSRGGRACVLSAGETTVRVVGRGRGGRNQELALAAAGVLATTGPAALASLGTDGIDGPTDAAGALADQTTLERAGRLGIGSPDRYLDDNDSYRFFEALGDLIRTGPTDTNVGDLQVLLLDEEVAAR
jgi:hydroxypyruvate reductase